MWDSWRAWCSPPRLCFQKCFKPALAPKGLGVPLPQATCFYPSALPRCHQGAPVNAAGPQPTNNYKKEAFFYIKPSPAPHSRSLSCTGRDPHVLLLAVTLANADKVVTALWPGAGDGLEARGCGCGCVAMLAPGHPCLPVWVAGEESSKHS